MHRLPAVSLALLLLSCAASTREARSRERFISNKEMLERMEHSNVQYRVSDTSALSDIPIERYADVLWPEGGMGSIAMLSVSDEERPAPAAQPLPPEVQKILERSEPLFEAQRYDEAGKLYQEALAIAPNSALLWLHWGDCAYFQQDLDAALERYQKAAQLDPDDYQVHFYLGQTLALMSRDAEAREEFTSSLLFRPRNPSLTHVLRRIGPRMGLTLKDAIIKPRAIALQRNDGIDVYVDKDHPYWIAFGVCKAIWLGDASYRQEMVGTPTHMFSTLEELDCLSRTVDAYEGAKKDANGKSDPEMERLITVVDAHMAGTLVLYELASRFKPDLARSLNADERKKLRAFIAQFVLVPEDT